MPKIVTRSHIRAPVTPARFLICANSLIRIWLAVRRAATSSKLKDVSPIPRRGRSSNTRSRLIPNRPTKLECGPSVPMNPPSFELIPAVQGRSVSKMAQFSNDGFGGKRELHQSLGIIFLAAVFAESVNLESMAGGGVVVFASDLLLQSIHFRREELHRTAAFGAYHVMVAAAVVLMLVSRNPIVESYFAGQSTLGQQLQGAVDRG